MGEGATELLVEESAVTARSKAMRLGTAVDAMVNDYIRWEFGSCVLGYRTKGPDCDRISVTSSSRIGTNRMIFCDRCPRRRRRMGFIQEHLGGIDLLFGFLFFSSLWRLFSSCSHSAVTQGDLMQLWVVGMAFPLIGDCRRKIAAETEREPWDERQKGETYHSIDHLCSAYSSCTGEADVCSGEDEDEDEDRQR
jgi:hypothetical protein